MTIDPKEISIPKLHAYMLASIQPRPIAFASTIDKNGNPNLAPFSFFNAFGSNPPTLIFSPARRVRDNTTKHTLENILEIPEVVINTVSYNMVQQVSLASVEFPRSENEFVKAGFTPLASERIKPFRVAESPVQFECRVVEVKPMGTEGGAANLIICEIILMHIAENILNEQQWIDPDKIDLVARMGADFYCRASGDAVFEVMKPQSRPAIGIDGLPEFIRNSKVLTGNDLGMLGNSEHFPTDSELATIDIRQQISAMQPGKNHQPLSAHDCQLLAKKLLEENKIMEAWKVLLSK